jgi:tetratricopeptide (TPR) repeat protein
LYGALRAAGRSQSPALLAQAGALLLHGAIQTERYAEAEHMLPFVQAAVAGPGGPGVEMLGIAALIDEAAILANRGTYDAALAALTRAEAQAGALGGRAAAEKLRAVAEQAMTLELKGDLAAAEQKYRDALELSRALHGPRHRAVLRAAENLAQSLSNAGKHGAARVALDGARALAAAFDPDTVEVITLEALEGNAWQAGGDCARAIPHFRAALERFTAVLGAAAPRVTKMHIRLGKCLFATGDAEAAAGHFSEWLERKVAENAPPDWQAEAGFWLAKALWELPRERRRAAAVAELARARYQAAGETYAPESAEIAAWLGQRRDLDRVSAAREPR